MRGLRRYHVCVRASGKRGTLYAGATGKLAERIALHREGRGGGFKSRYGVTRLVYADEFSDVHEAIAREKAMKKWRRAWKIELIEKAILEWRDLWFDLH